VAGEAPRIDPRSAATVAEELRRELSLLPVPDRPEEKFDPDRGLSGAMVGIFSRLAEIIIRRLNDVPGKNQLAFLNLLGASRLPPQPARVPLTFTLTASSATEAVVRESTQVAAPPAEGEKEPVIYETEHELVVTAARLDSVFVRDPELDAFADLGDLRAAPAPEGRPAFAGDRQIEHLLYVGHDYFGLSGLKAVRLKFALTASVADPRFVQWEIWKGTGYEQVGVEDGTDMLRGSGDVVINAPVLADNTPFPRTEVCGVPGRWLRCRLLTPITASKAALNTMVRASQLPSIESVAVSVTLDSLVDGKEQLLPPDAAFFNDLRLDTSKDFLPFGAAPRYGDTFYVAGRETFSKAGAKVTLTVGATNPVAADIPPPTTAGNPKLRWEYWNGAKWAELGTVDKAGKVTRENPSSPDPKLEDETKALTTGGTVKFNLPNDAAPTAVNGVENAWVRVRIVEGNYGVPPAYVPVKEKDSDAIKGYALNKGTLAPPSLSSLGVDYSLTTPLEPAEVVACNDLVCERQGLAAISPFQPSKDEEPSLYLGFSPPPPRGHEGTRFPNRKLSIYVEPVDFKHGESYGPVWPLRSRKAGGTSSLVKHKFRVAFESPLTVNPTLRVNLYGSAWITERTWSIEVQPGKTTELVIPVLVPADAAPTDKDRGFLRLTWEGWPTVEHVVRFETFASEEEATRRPQLSWEYWNGVGWAALVVRDDTRNLTLPGLFEFIAPADFAARDEFGRERFWLRARWTGGGYSFPPHLSRLLLNTVTAVQAVTVRGETLGSSDASAGQKFRTLRAPVLPGEQLEVREPEMPSDAEAAKIRREEGDDSISVVKDGSESAKEVWVRWHGTPDFYSSGPRDRHYVLDRLTGEVRFGDGLNGMIPPALAGNLRLRRYQTGGGTVGNRPAGIVTQMKTTVPYVDKVTNFLPAAGGAAAEDLPSLIDRAPRTLRHGERAVTIEDYEDLARQATPEVARVKCVPLYDLASDPDATRRRMGAVSLIIVPRSSEPRPLPSLELLGRVRDFLDGHRTPHAELFVVGPDYVGVDVTVTLGLSSMEGAREVEAAVAGALSRFLHPLTGGLDRKGWDFGRKPHKSDLFALLEETPGVDHVIALSVIEKKERADATTTERALVYSGAHTISLTVEAA
jgi:Baseplate J-like protein